jgi:drug/metabolite transporter (DMT)-like permease
VFVGTAVTIAAAAWWYSRPEMRGVEEWIGVALLGVMGGALVTVAYGLMSRESFATVFGVLSKMHPLAVLGFRF